MKGINSVNKIELDNSEIITKLGSLAWLINDNFINTQTISDRPDMDNGSKNRPSGQKKLIKLIVPHANLPF